MGLADDGDVGPPAGPQRAKRLLFTGDSLSGAEALEWGLAIEAPPADELDGRAEALVERIARSRSTSCG